MKNIYLVRHGEALDDINNTFGGWADDPLTASGKKLAKELAKSIEHFKPKRIFSSPLLRAKVTAEIIGQHLRIPVEVVENLKERNRYGILTDMNMDQAKKKYPELVEQAKDYHQTIKGAETYDHFKNRVLIALLKIFRRNSDDILIICHGGTFRLVMWELLNKPNFIKADLHAIVHIKDVNGNFSLANSKGLNFKN